MTVPFGVDVAIQVTSLRIFSRGRVVAVGLAGLQEVVTRAMMAVNAIPMIDMRLVFMSLLQSYHI
jgi:hypothetical protein